jgi:CHAD domain-containing protein
LASRRYSRLLLDVAEWIDAGEWLKADDPGIAHQRDESAVAFARRALTARTRRLVKRGNKLRDLDVRRRHKLRIAAKKLRYAAEAFARLFVDKAAGRRKKFVAALRQMQDCLGALNDITADSELSAAIAHEVRQPSGRARRLQYVAGIAAGYEAAQRDALLKASCKAHRRFAQARPFWK